jgi:hypothetical protein
MGARQANRRRVEARELTAPFDLNDAARLASFAKFNLTDGCGGFASLPYRRDSLTRLFSGLFIWDRTDLCFPAQERTCTMRLQGKVALVTTGAELVIDGGYLAQ